MKNFLYMTESEKTEWETSSSLSETATSEAEPDEESDMVDDDVVVEDTPKGLMAR